MKVYVCQYSEQGAKDLATIRAKEMGYKDFNQRKGRVALIARVAQIMTPWMKLKEETRIFKPINDTLIIEFWINRPPTHLLSGAKIKHIRKDRG